MLMNSSNVWFCDFEFSQESGCNGGRPVPVCAVFRECWTGRTIHCWQDDLRAMRKSPIPTDATVVAYYASAEIGCFLALGWTLPLNVLDLFTEFRNRTNGLSLPCGAGLLGALIYFGLDSMAADEKEEMRRLILRGGPWTAEERQAITDYCEGDVIALSNLYNVMAPHIDLLQALLRGRYMMAAARIEWNGVPLNMERFDALRGRWDEIKLDLIREIDAEYNVFDGAIFKADRFECYLSGNSMPWPRLDSGKLDLKEDTFRDMAKLYPKLQPLRELRSSLAQLRFSDIAIGPDGRNRCLLSAFRAKTGRNQPSNSKFVFGPAVWLRSLIRPEPGRALAYIDWSMQEFGIAAALSGDKRMMNAYLSGDPYLEFAKLAGAAPASATKETHRTIRDAFKQTVLATQYGMGEDSLSVKINATIAHARDLLECHRTTFRDFWKWSDDIANYAAVHGQIRTVFGWTLHVPACFNDRSIRNFPVQGNGAEMLRLACTWATESGISVAAPVHDALLVEGSIETIKETVKETREIMSEASKLVLDEFELRTDAKTFAYPDHYHDERGKAMEETIGKLMGW